MPRARPTSHMQQRVTVRIKQQQQPFHCLLVESKQAEKTPSSSGKGSGQKMERRRAKVGRAAVLGASFSGFLSSEFLAVLFPGPSPAQAFNEEGSQ